MTADQHLALMAAFLFLFLLSDAASDLVVVSVSPGQDAFLPCKAAAVPIRAVEWSRPDLEPDYVFFYRDRRLDATHQHSSFKGRVDLLDRDLKDGNVSLTLKNVNGHDTGTYECRVASGVFRRTKRAIIDSEPITIIHLQVTDSNSGRDKDGKSPPVGLYIGLRVLFALLFFTGLLIVIIWLKKNNQLCVRAAQSDSLESDDVDL